MDLGRSLYGTASSPYYRKDFDLPTLPGTLNSRMLALGERSSQLAMKTTFVVEMRCHFSRDEEDLSDYSVSFIGPVSEIREIQK